MSEGEKLDLVVCGSDGTLKSSISEQIQQQTDRRSDVELHGCLIRLVELPALIRLSEEELMHHTLHCVSLCHPGVHVFLFIIADNPLNNEVKVEIDKIRRIFSPIIRNHLMVLIIQEKNKTSKMNTVPSSTETCLQTFGGEAHCDLVRIVLLAKTGAGKMTRDCQKDTSELNRRRITVIDTPGLFDTGVDNVEIRKEIVKCISMVSPGPHVFLLVIQLGRFTNEEKEAVKGDDFRGTTIQDFIEDDDSLQYLIQQCGKRYHVFNNIETEDQTQVSELLDKIDCMVAVNKGSGEEHQRGTRENTGRERKEIKRIEEELTAKYEAEIEQMKKENERERPKMQKNERRNSKRQKEIKKETNKNLRKKLQRKLEEKQSEFEEENKGKEKALAEQLQNYIKYMEKQHEKEIQKLQERIQYESRIRAECEYMVKLEKKVSQETREKHEPGKAKALQKAEDRHEREKAKAVQEAEEKHKKAKAKVPYRSKRARDWSFYVPVFGGAAGGAVAGTQVSFNLNTAVLDDELDTSMRHFVRVIQSCT
ncbi:GTPase IMAP family member 4 [Labeo rohita]|uniref:GTPase IMAP family member 4 n=1 Tax=Labeo rohita TaxID=84645 RepID=A0ABQ8MVA9_LABRO|nr:GTPase IMAP family member 4 [Labeo rohita]